MKLSCLLTCTLIDDIKFMDTLNVTFGSSLIDPVIQLSSGQSQLTLLLALLASLILANMLVTLLVKQLAPKTLV